MKKPRRGAAVFGLALACLGLATGAAALEEDYSGKPDWYVYHRGLEHFRGGRFGEALRAMKELQDPSRVTPPEVYVLIGKIYREEGENDLAERFLKRALADAPALGVPQDRYEILYLLADIHYRRKSYKNYEDVLESILSDHSLYRDERYARLREGYLRTARERGFDSFVSLYRQGDDFTRAAHLGLGVFAVRTGRDEKGALHLIFADLAAVSTLIGFQRDRDPDYVFSSLPDLLARARRLPGAEDYIEETELHKGLYYLASALHRTGGVTAARELWKTLADFGTGEWKIRSGNQLRSPQAEPLISY